MTAESLFSIAGTLVLPGWLILILAPRRWPILNAIPKYVIPLILSALYALLVLRNFGESGGGYGSLAEVRQLFTHDMVLLAGWVHYLAFDLFVGAWCAEKMDRAGVHRILQAFIFPAIFLFGPAGFLLAMAIVGGINLLPAKTQAPA